LSSETGRDLLAGGRGIGSGLVLASGVVQEADDVGQGLGVLGGRLLELAHGVDLGAQTGVELPEDHDQGADDDADDKREDEFSFHSFVMRRAAQSGVGRRPV